MAQLINNISVATVTRKKFRSLRMPLQKEVLPFFVLIYPSKHLETHQCTVCAENAKPGAQFYNVVHITCLTWGTLPDFRSIPNTTND